jgi:hypothetical protein
MHPVQQRSRDAVVRRAKFEARTGKVVVPALTTVVFVSPE